LTLWPLLFSHRDRKPSVLPALDIESGSLAVRDMSFAVKDGVDWQLAMSRPTHSTEQLYRFAGDGRFLGMQEMMPLLWLRELVPVT
jgi:hypothetical protein